MAYQFLAALPLNPLPIELCFIQLAYKPPSAEQLLVGAALDNRPRSMTRIRSAARMVLRRWAMTMLVRPAMTRFRASWIRDFGFAVEVAGGFVQDQDARVLEDYPCQGDALFLAAAQTVAALADDRVVAFGQVHDEIVDIGRPGRGFDLGLGGIQSWHRSGWCGWYRGRGSSPASPCRSRMRANSRVTSRRSCPSMRMTPLVGIVQARDQIGQGGFAGAGRTDQRDQLSGPGGKGDALQGDIARLGGRFSFGWVRAVLFRTGDGGRWTVLGLPSPVLIRQRHHRLDILHAAIALDFAEQL